MLIKCMSVCRLALLLLFRGKGNAVVEAGVLRKARSEQTGRVKWREEDWSLLLPAAFLFLSYLQVACRYRFGF